MAFLDVLDLHVKYGNIEVLHGIELRVNKGEIVAILGANGAGKSTTLLTISGLVRPSGGSVVFGELPIHKLPAHAIVKLGIAQAPVEGRLPHAHLEAGGTLSGGEQQMLAIGRALMSQPKILLLDEPSLGLAPLLVKTIFQTLREINATGVTIVLVEQNARAALKLAHRGYVMELGNIVLEGPSAELMANSEVQAAYLGTGSQ